MKVKIERFKKEDCIFKFLQLNDMRRTGYSLDESIDAFDSTQLHRLTRESHIARYDWVVRKLSNEPGLVILDAACGRGYGTKILADTGMATGVDIYPKAVDYAERRYGNGRVKFTAIDLESPEFQSRFTPGSIDVIVSFETLEHCENPVAVLRNFYNALKRSGMLYVSVPNGLHEKKNSTGNPKNRFHVNSYTLKELQDILESADFRQFKFYGQAPIYGAVKGYLRKLETAFKNGNAQTPNNAQAQANSQRQKSSLSVTVRNLREGLAESLGFYELLNKPREILVETANILMVDAVK